MSQSRQQRRAAARKEEKRRTSDAKAKVSAVRRAALIKSWRERRAAKLTFWQKVAFVAELVFLVLLYPIMIWAPDPPPDRSRKS